MNKLDNYGIETTGHLLGLFEMLPRERRLPSEELKEAEKLVVSQVNNKLMRDHFEEKTGKKIVLKDISNIVTKVNSSRKTQDLESLVNKLKETVEIFHDSDNQLQGLFYQDAEMQRVYSAFPEIIFIDATYKLNDRRMPLYIMMVEDSLGQSEVAAVCLLNSELKPNIQQFIRCFKENNPGYVNTKVIMADKDINERHVFTDEIPNALLLICQFHVLRTFNREISTEKMCISLAQRHTALELLQKLVYSSSEKEYETVLEQVRTTCPRQIHEYIMNNWHDIRHEWVLGLKLCKGALMNTTNNRLESFNQKLKQVVKLYSCLDIFFEKFLVLINTIRNERDHKASNDIQKVPVVVNAMKKNSAEFKFSQLLTGYGNKFVLDQLAKARKINNMNSETSNNNNNKLIGDDVELCTESCTCTFRKSMGLPCKHIFLARSLIDIELFDASLCHDRWTRSYFLQHMRLVNPPCSTSTNSTVTVTHVKQTQAKTVLSENQKYKKAFVLAQKLAAACAEVGMKEYNERLKILQELLESWKSDTPLEKEITSSKTQEDDVPFGDRHTQVPSDIINDANYPSVHLVQACSSGLQTDSSKMQKDVPEHQLQEFLHAMADHTAAIQAESGINQIEEDSVHIKAEELLPKAELLLNLQIQLKAKKFFTHGAWKTAESTLNVLEDLHLKMIKRKEFPPIITNRKGTGKKTFHDIRPSVIVENTTIPENIWIMKAKQNSQKISHFLKSHKPSKSMPSIGDSITVQYEDPSSFLTAAERSSLSTYLCATYKELRIPTSTVTYLLHDTIKFIVTDFKFPHHHKEFMKCNSDDNFKQNNSTTACDNVPLLLKDIKLPPKLRMKGRPKGSGQTVIGLSKKSRRATKKQPKPFFKKCNQEKEKVILEWIVGRDSAEKALRGEEIDQNAILDTIPSTCSDTYVDMSLVKQYFSSDGWDKVNEIMGKKRQKPDYTCQTCLLLIDFNLSNVICDSCLNVYHLPCVGLKSLPKVRHWYCKDCKQC